MIDIVPATLSEYSFIAANMRQEDQDEIYCQLPPEATSLDIAIFSLSGRFAYTARWRGKAVAAFGFSQLSLCGSVYSGWMWGTRDLPRAVPRISRYSWAVIAPKLVAAHVRRVEVRSRSGHLEAHKWLTDVGAKWECKLLDYGRDGEAFELFVWTETEVRERNGMPVLAQRARTVAISNEAGQAA